jgi:hypothetical protein
MADNQQKVRQVATNIAYEGGLLDTYFWNGMKAVVLWAGGVAGFEEDYTVFSA